MCNYAQKVFNKHKNAKNAKNTTKHKNAKFQKSTNLSEFVLEIKKIYFYQLIRSADDQILKKVRFF